MLWVKGQGQITSLYDLAQTLLSYKILFKISLIKQPYMFWNDLCQKRGPPFEIVTISTMSGSFRYVISSLYNSMQQYSKQICWLKLIIILMLSRGDQVLEYIFVREKIWEIDRTSVVNISCVELHSLLRCSSYMFICMYSLLWKLFSAANQDRIAQIKVCLLWVI